MIKVKDGEGALAGSGDIEAQATFIAAGAESLGESGAQPVGALGFALAGIMRHARGFAHEEILHRLSAL